MELRDKLTTSDDVVAREVAGETVLLNLASGTYFGLDEIGGKIWQWLETEDCTTLDEVCDQLVEEYHIEREVAERDVVALATDLEEQGLISREEA